MQTFLNLVGVICGAILFLTALRMLKVGKKCEISPRSVLALCVAAASSLAVARVLAGGALTFPHVLMLMAAAGYVLCRLWQMRETLRTLPGVPARRTDFGELL